MTSARFCYFYDTSGEHRKPMVTICRLQDDAGDYGYSWAICSEKDNPCKRTGRAIAHGRAVAALEHKVLLALLRKPGNNREIRVFFYSRSIVRQEAARTLRRVVTGLKKTNCCFDNVRCAPKFLMYLPLSMQPREGLA